MSSFTDWPNTQHNLYVCVYIYIYIYKLFVFNLISLNFDRLMLNIVIFTKMLYLPRANKIYFRMYRDCFIQTKNILPFTQTFACHDSWGPFYWIRSFNNDGLTKPLLKIGLGLVITPHCFTSMQLLIHAVVMMLAWLTSSWHDSCGVYGLIAII